jgi:small subunit ribosomal protein S16
VLEKTSGPKAGKYVDLVGTYNPKTKECNLKPELIKSWMSKGAKLSPSVFNLLVSKGVMEGKKKPVISEKNLTKHIAKRKAEEEAAAAKVAAEEAKAAEKAAADTKAAEDAAAAEAAAAVEAPVEEAAPEVAEEAPAAEAETTETPVEEAAVEAA